MRTRSWLISSLVVAALLGGFATLLLWPPEHNGAAVAGDPKFFAGFLEQASGGGGSGDVTEVQCGTGLSCATGTGPIPVVSRQSWSRQWHYYDDFTGFTSGATASRTLMSSVSGTGAAVTIVTGATGTGSASCNLGTTTTGRCHLFGQNNLSTGWLEFNAAMGMTYVEAGVTITTLATAGEDFDWFVGFGDNQTAAPTDGAYFQHLDTDANWRCVLAQAGSRTTVDSGVAAVAGALDRLRVEIDGACTAARFYVDDVAVCGAIALTNCPTTSANATGVLWGGIKSAGTTARVGTIDYIEYGGSFTAAR